MVGAMDTPPWSIPASPVGFAVPRACPWWYLGILLGELSNLLLSLGHVMSQQKGTRRAPVLQQWGEGVGVPWEHPQTVPLQGRDVPTAGPPLQGQPGSRAPLLARWELPAAQQRVGASTCSSRSA